MKEIDYEEEMYVFIDSMDLLTESEIRIRSFLTYTYIYTALDLTYRSYRKWEKDKTTTVFHECVSTFILSWSALESFINMLIEDTKKIHGLDNAGIERMSFVSKYKIIYRLFKKSPLEIDKEPAQSFVILNDIRNELIHFKSEWKSVKDLSPHKLVKKCEGKFPIKGNIQGIQHVLPWTIVICSPHGAIWCCKVTLEFLRHFHKCLRGVKDDYGRGFSSKWVNDVYKKFKPLFEEIA